MNLSVRVEGIGRRFEKSSEDRLRKTLLDRTAVRRTRRQSSPDDDVSRSRRRQVIR